MHESAQKLFYALGMFVLGTALFVFQPSNIPEVSQLQSDILHRLEIAFIQTIGDQPFFAEAELVYNSVEDFYTQSADAVVAMLTEPQMDKDIIYVYGQVYNRLAYAILATDFTQQTQVAYKNVGTPIISSNFMNEEPLYNIVPYRTIVKTIGTVAGASIDLRAMTDPVNSQNQPWVTMRDALTGQYYCLAVYNGEVNKYLGPCKFDYH